MGVFLPAEPVDTPGRFTDLVLPQLKKAGASDAPEPLSSNDVAADNGSEFGEDLRVWWRSR